MLKSVLAVSVVLVLGLSAGAQTTYYVDALTGNDSFPGTSPSFPFLTISHAAVVASANDGGTIRINPGDYDLAHESSGLGTGFPIVVDSEPLTFEAGGAANPRIGGDIASSAVEALFEVRSTGSGRLDATFRNLDFAGEDTPSTDAPGALLVETRDGAISTVTVDNCTIERSEMNASGTGGHPSIRGIGGPVPVGTADFNPPSLKLIVIGCTIEPNEPGGVVVDIGTDCIGGAARAAIDLRVQDSSFTLQNGDGALSAIDLLLDAYDPVTSSGLHADAICSITYNTIDSSAASGPSAGFATGLRLGGDARHGGDVTMSHTNTLVRYNSIHGCNDAGILFFADQDEHSTANIQSWRTDNNLVSENLGPGIVVDGGDLLELPPYIRLALRGNAIVDNASSGVLAKNIDASQQGNLDVLNCTIASNAGYGIEVDSGSWASYVGYVNNNIVWGNSIGGASGWNPCSGPYGTDGFVNNDWQDVLACVSTGCTPNAATSFNVSIDPLFFDPASGNYLLTSGSCCIDRGENSVAGPDTAHFERDIQGDRRRVDGDGDPEETIVADMGADEFIP